VFVFCFYFSLENKSQSNIYFCLKNLEKGIKVENSFYYLEKNRFNLLFQWQWLLVRDVLVSSRKEKAVPLTLKWENH